MNILQSSTSKQIPEKNAVTQSGGDVSDNDNRRRVSFKDMPRSHKTMDFESLDQDFQLTRPSQNFFGEPRKEKFMNRLINDEDSGNLISVFNEEPCYLKSSDAKETDFTLRTCFRRLKMGYTIIGFNYNTAQVQEVQISVGDSHLICEFESHSKHKIKFADLKGVLFGRLSSTFKLYRQRRGNLTTLGLDDSDAFTIVANERTFDFACTSELIKYDICIVTSWLAAENPLGCVPFTKFSLTFFKVKRKIHEMAHERGLYMKDLFLLAIIKALHANKESQEKINKVKDILDKRFTGTYKLFRICKHLNPDCIAQKYNAERDKENQRCIVLIARRKQHMKKKEKFVDILKKYFIFTIKFKLINERFRRYTEVLRAELPKETS